MIMCSRCKKRPAVVFISSISGSERKNEGLCIKCAKEMGLPQVTDYLKQLGISEEDFDNAYDAVFDENGMIDGELMKHLGLDGMITDETADDIEEGEDHADDLFERGGANTMPSFLKDLFGGKNEIKASDDENAEPKKKKKSEKTDKKRKTLETYCTNLTRRAKEGKIDRIIGRDKEINRVIQILSRRSKNNPCLIGEPGVGKTAIAEGIALRLNSGDVPFRLQGKELYLLDLTALVAGTQFRGQFESRVKALIDEVKTAGNIIIFIDEVHNLVGTGDADGTMNAGNMFKPALSRGELQVIGATTFNEYRKHIEKDSALERRFQPVTINEPTINETVELLEGIKEYYESHHKVKISSELTRMCAVLSERYINDRFLPDKAIDLLDESCACASLKNEEITEYEKLKTETDKLRAEEAELAEASEIDYAKRAELKTLIAKNDARIEEIKSLAENVQVTIEDLSKVIELWTGIPANKIKETEFKRIAHLEDALKSKVIGQDEACELVAKAIKRTRVQLSERRRPASFIFVGPTGVGKTELVKVLAKEMFDTVEPLIRLDMSEFMEKHAVSRIIGAPPGYVGYDEAGQLTEKIRRRPYSVVLFDEIEKAHPDVLNVLLQILDDGKVTDAHGKEVNFCNTVIVMTTNAGSQNTSNTAGFSKTENEANEDKTNKALSSFLRPEFMNRIDEIITFNSLTKDDFIRIAKIMLGELKASLSEKQISLEYTEEVPSILAEKSYSVKYGARNLRRTIQTEIEDKASELIISSYDSRMSGISIYAENGEIKIIVTKA